MHLSTVNPRPQLEGSTVRGRRLPWHAPVCRPPRPARVERSIPTETRSSGSGTLTRVRVPDLTLTTPSLDVILASVTVMAGPVVHAAGPAGAQTSAPVRASDGRPTDRGRGVGRPAQRVGHQGQLLAAPGGPAGRPACPQSFAGNAPQRPTRGPGPGRPPPGPPHRGAGPPCGSLCRWIAEAPPRPKPRAGVCHPRARKGAVE